MSNLREQFEQEDLQELLREEFNPDLFYKALNNALAQLETLHEGEVEAA